MAVFLFICMSITIINDCRDFNARGRQIARLQSIFQKPINFVGVANDLEAAGNLMDILDAHENRDGVILVNVAPRHGEGKKYPNGTPFGYFWYQNTLVVSTIAGLSLSLVKKLHITPNIKVLDIHQCLEEMAQKEKIKPEQIDYIEKTQFRSYDFVPRIAKYLLEYQEAPHDLLDVSEIANVQRTIWWIDNFGNCKTTLLKEEIELLSNGNVQTKFGELPFYPRLKDVPNGEKAIIVGSSGLYEKRFLEIIIQGKSAAEYFGVSTSSNIFRI